MGKLSKYRLVAWQRFMFLTAFLLLFVTQTASATEGLRQRGCRVGTLSPQFRTRRARALTNGENPYIGNRRQLVVLAAFQDQDFVDGGPAALETWNRIFNAQNYNEGMYVGSVHDYFISQSYGQFNLTFDLVQLTLSDVQHKYRSTYSDDEFSQYMVDDIVDILGTEDIDWSLYDWDGDTYVDQLLILYAGKGMNDGGGSNTIWPHQWWLSQHMNLDTENKWDYRSYRTVSCGEQTYIIDCYCCVQEVAGYSMGSTFGVVCHEYSHCFGFPDFYYGDSKVVGDWDLMDNGNYSGAGFHPCGYSAHERMLMGWLTPIELTDSVTITDIPALCDEPQAYLIRNDDWPNEYYIIENRQQRDWDETLPGSGILIFHIDFDKEIWEGCNEYPNDNQKKRYSLFPANNNTKYRTSADWAYPYIVTDSKGNESVLNDCLTDTSAPAAVLNNERADGSLLMSKPVTHMRVNAQGLASFDFMQDKTTAVEIISGKWQDDKYYTLDGRCLSGKPVKSGIYVNDGKKVVVK